MRTWAHPTLQTEHQFKLALVLHIKKEWKKVMKIRKNLPEEKHLDKEKGGERWVLVAEEEILSALAVEEAHILSAINVDVSLIGLSLSLFGWLKRAKPIIISPRNKEVLLLIHIFGGRMLSCMNGGQRLPHPSVLHSLLLNSMYYVIFPFIIPNANKFAFPADLNTQQSCHQS